MIQITEKEVRKILEIIFDANDRNLARLAKISDKKLLKTNLQDEFEMDSLDYEDMFCELYRLYHIDVDAHNRLIEYAFYNCPTVENFIEMCNKYRY